MAYQTYWEDEGIYWLYRGIVTEKEVLDSNYAFYSNPKSLDYRYQIIDGLEVESFDLNPSVLQELAALDSSHAITQKNLKLAFIATKPNVIDTFKDYMKYSRMLRNHWQMKWFMHIHEARQWINEP